MRAGLHNIMDGFINGLSIAFQTVEQGFVRALHTVSADNTRITVGGDIRTTAPLDLDTRTAY